MKLADWAKTQGIDYKTAYRRIRAGLFPIPAIQISTGTTLVSPPAETPSVGVALYGRVSSSGQKKELDRQMARLLDYATANLLLVTRAVEEI